MQFDNYVNITNNNDNINLENNDFIENNSYNSLDIFENKNYYDSDFSLSKLDSIGSLKFSDIWQIN